MFCMTICRDIMSSFWRWQLEKIPDKAIEFGACDIHRGMRIFDSLPASCRGSHKFTGTRKLDDGLQTQLMALFNRYGFVTSC
jgi:hypothetical protein